MRLSINIAVSILSLVAIIWGACFALAQERRRTPQYLQNMYDDLNAQFFEGALPTARVEWADLTNAEAMGQTFQENDDSFVIQVDRNTNFSFWIDNELRDTVEHEACHIATWAAEADSHGAKWRECMSHIRAK